MGLVDILSLEQLWEIKKHVQQECEDARSCSAMDCKYYEYCSVGWEAEDAPDCEAPQLVCVDEALGMPETASTIDIINDRW